MKKPLLCIWATITISNLSAQDNANTKVFWKENFNSSAALPIGWKNMDMSKLQLMILTSPKQAAILMPGKKAEQYTLKQPG